MADEQMTRRDREDLVRVAKLRAKVAKDGVAEQEARMRADVEQQLSAKYSIADEKWAHITQSAKDAVAAADEQVAAVCRDLGIPEEFRPSLDLYWYSRGENAAAARRLELRKLAEARITAVGRAAKTAIDAKTADVVTELIAGGLQSEDARRHLEGIPTPEQLMPRLDVAELEQQRKKPKPLRAVSWEQD